MPSAVHRSYVERITLLKEPREIPTHHIAGVVEHERPREKLLYQLYIWEYRLLYSLRVIDAFGYLTALILYLVLYPLILRNIVPHEQYGLQPPPIILGYSL